ncbi:hypothetical protein [Mycolicibacterium sp. D5.8-2]|uniref:hypothetical protein n=1 Tax=Mycolicibacterium sp. D5.8-2 TaxID=3085903 RepID=UPI00298CD104|nr:hypothetical protein [Mycolicibacterium sp. D5.8-2]MDW5614962.1 hypothetical protein [Mycolicibacterium sp. D5.8-2]
MSDDRNYLRQPGEDFPREWMGSAGFEADWPVRQSAQSPEELAGLDRSEWTVMAINLLPPTRPGTGDTVFVYALRKDAIPRKAGQHPNDDLRDYVAEHGSFPVTKFHVPNLSVQDVFDQMKTGIIQLRPHGIDGMQMHVIADEEAPGPEGG